MKGSLSGGILLFPDGTNGFTRYACRYNLHILSYYLHKMSIAKDLKCRSTYEYFVKQNNLEFKFNFIAMPYEVKLETMQVEHMALVPSLEW